MAKKYSYGDPKVGDLVYEPFSPKKAGKIIEVVGRRKFPDRPDYVCPFFEVKVRWAKDGSVTVCDSGQLNGFQDLIDDHERKLATHMAMKARLEAL